MRGMGKIYKAYFGSGLCTRYIHTTYPNRGGVRMPYDVLAAAKARAYVRTHVLASEAEKAAVAAVSTWQARQTNI